MTIPAIEADIQDQLICLLPDDYHTAIEVLAQLSANILLSGERFNIEKFIDKLRKHHAAYIVDELQ